MHGLLCTQYINMQIYAPITIYRGPPQLAFCNIVVYKD